jgi:hypothetical protein
MEIKTFKKLLLENLVKEKEVKIFYLFYFIEKL